MALGIITPTIRPTPSPCMINPRVLSDRRLCPDLVMAISSNKAPLTHSLPIIGLQDTMAAQVITVTIGRPTRYLLQRATCGQGSMFRITNGQRSPPLTTLKFHNIVRCRRIPTPKLLETTHQKMRLVIRKYLRQGPLNAEGRLGINMVAAVAVLVNLRLG